MMKRRIAIIITIFLSAVSFPSLAQQPQQPQQPTLAQSATDTFDSVVLSNGGFFRGRITEIVPDDHVTIVLEAGETKRIAWSEISRIVTSTVPTAAPPSPTKPPPQTPPTVVPAPTTPTTPPAEMLPPTTPQNTQWRANRPLLVTGAILFAAGYGPNLILAAPSTIGLVGRVVILVLTLGLPCLFNSSDDYICEGEHGAMQLLIPFAGPVMFANNHPQDSVINENGRQTSEVAKGLLYTSSVLQIAGVTSILGSLVFGKDEKVPARKASLLPQPENTTSPKFFVRPLEAPNSVGISVGFHRW